MRGWRRVGLIGHGAIGSVVAGELAKRSAHTAPVLAGVLMRPGRAEAARRALGADVAVVETLDELLACDLDVVAECGGQEALRAHGEAVLAAGCDLVPIATGAFADRSWHERMLAAAAAGGARIHIPAGAIAGIDGLVALRLAGLDHVHYSSTKPPVAWKGTPADGTFDLDGLDVATVVFEGSARDAAALYPKNANLAATVALAGIGFERTSVRLIADPAATGNSGRIEARGTLGRLDVNMAAHPSPDNPKTSATTAWSVLRTLANGTGTLAI
jgi:aspartate dehydrogenase